MTPYQRAVVETWIAEAHARGEDREEAIAHVLCAFGDDQEAAVREVFDERWPEVSK